MTYLLFCVKRYEKVPQVLHISMDDWYSWICTMMIRSLEYLLTKYFLLRNSLDDSWPLINIWCVPDPRIAPGTALMKMCSTKTPPGCTIARYIALQQKTLQTHVSQFNDHYLMQTRSQNCSRNSNDEDVFHKKHWKKRIDLYCRYILLYSKKSLKHMCHHLLINIWCSRNSIDQDSLVICSLQYIWWQG